MTFLFRYSLKLRLVLYSQESIFSQSPWLEKEITHRIMNYNISCLSGGTVPAPAVFYLMKEWALLFWHLARHLVTLLLLWARKQTTSRCYGFRQWKYIFLTFKGTADREPFFLPSPTGSCCRSSLIITCVFQVYKKKVIKFRFVRMNETPVPTSGGAARVTGWAGYHSFAAPAVVTSLLHSFIFARRKLKIYCTG